MANPYLILGGVVVAVATAGIGVLQVPGWINDAKNSLAANDLAQVNVAETAADTLGYGYLAGGELDRVADSIKVRITPSDGVTLCVTRDEERTAWVAVAQASTGDFFARASGHDETGQGDSPVSALDDAGGLPAGVDIPFDGGACVAGAAVTGHADSGGDGDGGAGAPTDADEAGLADDLAALGLRVGALEDETGSDTGWNGTTDDALSSLSSRVSAAEQVDAAQSKSIDSAAGKVDADDSTSQASEIAQYEKTLAQQKQKLRTLAQQITDLSSDSGAITSGLGIKGSADFAVKSYEIHIRNGRLTGSVNATYQGGGLTHASEVGNFVDVNSAVTMPKGFRSTEETRTVVVRNGVQEFFARIRADSGAIDFTHGLPGVEPVKGDQYTFVLDYYID